MSFGQAREEPGADKAPDWTVPAMEIIGFDLLVNRVNRYAGKDRQDYSVSRDSIRRNLRSNWDTDADPFEVNQLGHPYQGSMYYGFARSSGFSFWESAGFALGGSALWEIAGERTPPSRNDMISTTAGGTVLGESLFRMAHLLLEKGGGMSPFWRETAAAVVSPSTAFNRYLQGRGPETIFSSRGAAVSLGTAGQWRGENVVVQGTAMAGLGYAAVGTINSLSATVDRDYRYGVAPQALAAARVIFGDRSSFDLTARQYFVSDVAANARKGSDSITRADIAYTWRVKDQHAFTVKYLWNRRDARYPDVGDRGQKRGTFGVFYTLLGQDRFGTVDWK